VARRNAELEAVLAELHGASIPYRIEQNGGHHLKVRFSAHGREEFVTVSVSSSDTNSIHAARATTRRILKGLRPGDTGPTEKRPEPPPGPAATAIAQAESLLESMAHAGPVLPGPAQYAEAAAKERWLTQAEARRVLRQSPSWERLVQEFRSVHGKDRRWAWERMKTLARRVMGWSGP
jgi:hypothetical protein